MHPNSVLSVWQLTIMAVVPVVLLFAWLIAIYVASREPARQDLAVAGLTGRVGHRRDRLACSGQGRRAGAGAAARRPAGRLVQRPDATVAIRPPDGLSRSAGLDPG